MVKTMTLVGGGTSVASVIAAVGWPGLALLTIVVLTAVMGLCYIVSTKGRADAFVSVIRAYREPRDAQIGKRSK